MVTFVSVHIPSKYEASHYTLLLLFLTLKPPLKYSKRLQLYCIHYVLTFTLFYLLPLTLLKLHLGGKFFHTLLETHFRFQNLRLIGGKFKLSVTWVLNPTYLLQISLLSANKFLQCILLSFKNKPSLYHKINFQNCNYWYYCVSQIDKKELWWIIRNKVPSFYQVEPKVPSCY